MGKIQKKLKHINDVRKRFILTNKEAKDIERTLTKIKAEFNNRVSGFNGEDIWDLREFLMLLELADDDYLGKSKAITYAYQIGFIDGQKKIVSHAEKHFRGEAK